jgi:hypothetical protein
MWLQIGAAVFPCERGNRAWKLRQEPVARVLDDAAAVFGDCGRELSHRECCRDVGQQRHREADHAERGGPISLLKPGAADRQKTEGSAQNTLR